MGFLPLAGSNPVPGIFFAGQLSVRPGRGTVIAGCEGLGAFGKAFFLLPVAVASFCSARDNIQRGQFAESALLTITWRQQDDSAANHGWSGDLAYC